MGANTRILRKQIRSLAWFSGTRPEFAVCQWRDKATNDGQDAQKTVLER